MICVVCGAELEPFMVEDMAGHKVHWTLRYRKDELVFYCPGAIPGDGHGMNLWTETWIECWLRMKKRLKKVKY